MRSLTLPFLLFIVTGCSNRTFVPTSFSADSPKAVIGAVETSGLSVFMENLDQNGSHFIYDLEVVNNSDQPVLVDPHGIYYYGANEAFEPLKEQMDVHSTFGEAAQDARGVFALNEEKVNRDIKTTIKAKQTLAFVLLLAATAVVVNDVVQDSKDFNKEFWSKSDVRRSNARDVGTFAGLVTIDMIRLGMEMEQRKEYEDLQYLPEEYLHKTLVLPGESIRGKVFLPRRGVKYIRMVVPLESSDYIFDFRQASGQEMRLIRR